jgi:hypothetical protein
MNLTHKPLNAFARVLCTVAMVAVTGCVTYVREEPRHPAYTPPPPPPVQPPPPVIVAPAAQTVIVVRTERDFYEPLTPYGEWIVVGSYGRCWRPARVRAEWRPYANGYWQRTDAGWYWVSDEPWAWATYHYGRWELTAQFGWLWVPQTEWAPAWVAWREGGGYVGWAPLPPSARIVVGGGLEVHEAVIAPRFVFVEERRLLEPVRPTTVIVNNTTVVNKTINITKIKVVNKTVINEGPRVETVEQATGRKVQPVAVRELRHKDETEAEARHHQERDNADRKKEPSARTISDPQSAVASRPASEAARPAPVADRDQAHDADEPHHGKPEHAEKKNEPATVAGQPATQPMVSPESKPAVVPHPEPAIVPPAEVRKASPANQPREVRPPKNAPVSVKAEPPATTTPPNKHQAQAEEKRAERELKASQAKSDAKEKAAGNARQKEKKGGRPESTNNPAPSSPQ